MTRKYIIVADDSLKGFDEEIAKLEREWGAEEIEPCDDCISREEVLAKIDEERKHLLDLKMDGAEHIVVHHARRIIEDMPPVTPQPKVGEWLKNGELCKCSRCDSNVLFSAIKFYKYCYRCGARMEVET